MGLFYTAALEVFTYDVAISTFPLGFAYIRFHIGLIQPKPMLYGQVENAWRSFALGKMKSCLNYGVGAVRPLYC